MTSPVAADQRNCPDSSKPQRTPSLPVKAIWTLDHTGGPDGYGGSQEAVRELVPVGPGHEGADRGVARAGGPCRPNDRRALGGHSGPLDSRSDDGLHGGTQQPVLGCEAQGPRVSVGRIHDNHALLRRRETHPTVMLTH